MSTSLTLPVKSHHWRRADQPLNSPHRSWQLEAGPLPREFVVVLFYCVCVP